MSNELEKLSKFLSFVLRHKPEQIGISLDAAGWVDVEILIDAAHKQGVNLSRELLAQVVAQNNKQRFAFSANGQQIRANQGHSIKIELNLCSKIPPDKLLHGTARRFLDSILEQGLLKMQRHHVHLTENQQIAIQVGSRYGKPVLLEVNAKAMVEAGCLFYQTENQVWLVEYVNPCYITVI